MISIEVKFNRLETFLKRKVDLTIDTMVEKLQNSDKIKLLLKRNINENIDKKLNSNGSKYINLTYDGYGSTIKKNTDDKPLQTLKPVILRNTIKSRYNKENKILTFSFQFAKEDSKRYLIHNQGGRTYNPYAVEGISIIPKREFLHIPKSRKKSILREVKRVANS